MPEQMLVAMSGGVDSSVAAALLHEQGYDVVGVTLEVWGKEVCSSAGSRLCCSVRDTLDAKAVAKRLGIRHEVLNVAETFRATVIDGFLSSYRQGLTPNPCITCNDHIKFGALLQHAEARGISAIATGHYARLTHAAAGERHVLRRAVDPSKDQSYVLFDLTQTQLARARLPIGELKKSEVRALAADLGLVTAEKPESQDLCFIRDGKKDGFLRRELRVAEEPGPITDTAGRVLGAHRGVLGYTIGQREGLGLAVGHPLYVIAIDPAKNRLVVGSKQDLLRVSMQVAQVNWVSIEPLTSPRSASVQIRSGHQAAAARLIPQVDAQVRVEFEQPQSAITPGQAAVFYEADVVLGGGWIKHVHSP